MAHTLPPGVAIARAENAARSLFTRGRPPKPELMFAALRETSESCIEVAEVWDLVLVRLAEMQAAADGYPARSINERAA